MSNETYECPVCGERFETVGEADRHYDYHKASEYILTWKVQQDGGSDA